MSEELDKSLNRLADEFIRLRQEQSSRLVWWLMGFAAGLAFAGALYFIFLGQGG